jgi:hypothetical protein
MRCSKCNKSTNEYLVTNVLQRKLLFFENPKVETNALCREHLFPEFKDRFVNFSEKMIVFYPELEDRRGSYVYAYLSLGEVRRRKIGGGVVEEALAAVGGECRRCSGPGQIAYFGEGKLRRKVESALGIKWEFPLIESVVAEPEVLCRGCALSEIVPSLQKFPEFADGLCAPYGEEGVFITLEV